MYRTTDLPTPGQRPDTAGHPPVIMFGTGQTHAVQPFSTPDGQAIARRGGDSGATHPVTSRVCHGSRRSRPGGRGGIGQPDQSRQAAGRRAAPVAEQLPISSGAPRVDRHCGDTVLVQLRRQPGSQVEPGSTTIGDARRAGQRSLHLVPHRRTAPRSSAPQIAGPSSTSIRSACAPSRIICSTMRSAIPSAAPRRPGVDGGDHTGDRVGGQDRHAVGDQHSQSDTAVRRDDPSVSGNGSGAGRPVLERHPGHRRAVHLMHPDDPVRRQTGGGGEPFPVGRHRCGVVADAAAEVEAVVRRRRHTAAHLIARTRGDQTPKRPEHLP